MTSLRRMPVIFQLLLGVFLVVLVTLTFQVAVKKLTYDIRPGWEVIRPPHEVSALAAQGDRIWAGGKGGLMAFERVTARPISPPEGAPPMVFVWDLLIDAAGTLWVAHQDGLTRLREGRWETLEALQKVLPGPARALLEDRSGTLWIGGEKGVARFDGRSFERLPFPDKKALVSVDVLCQDRTGVYWFGSSSPTHGGLLRYGAGQWQAYSTRNGLVHNSVNCITPDSKGRLWFGLGFGSRGGACFLENGEWKTWTREDGLAGEKVRSIFEDRSGRLWFGSEYDGIAVLDGTEWRIFSPRDGLAGWEVKEMIEDEGGVYWLGTDKGLSRITALDWKS